MAKQKEEIVTTIKIWFRLLITGPWKQDIEKFALEAYEDSRKES